MSTSAPIKARGIERIGYQPPPGYGLDLEIFPASELRRRAGKADLGQPHRIGFHLLVLVTGGRCTHVVDFVPTACAPGSLLALRPGQVQRFDTDAPWDGWLLMFRSELLQPRERTASVAELAVSQLLEEMPVHRGLSASDLQTVTDCVARMFQDTQLACAAEWVQALLRSQLDALLIRLCLIQEHDAQARGAAPVLMQRFRRYRLAVEQAFPRQHRVAQYARQLGCSERSLNRATMDIAGVSAKAFLSQRIVLEAKRLLAHTASPVSVIANQLGFEETTNFVKFFRRETTDTPGAFRSRHAPPAGTGRKAKPTRRP